MHLKKQLFDKAVIFVSLPCRPSYRVMEAICPSKLATFMLTPKIGHPKSCLYYCYLISHLSVKVNSINFKGWSLGCFMPTILYLTAHQPAKRPRLTRSSFIAYRTSLGLTGGWEQFGFFYVTAFCMFSYNVLFQTKSSSDFWKIKHDKNICQDRHNTKAIISGEVAWSSSKHRSLPIQGSRVHFPVLTSSFFIIEMALMNLTGDQKDCTAQLQATALSTLWRSQHLKEGGSCEERGRDRQAKVE